MVKNPPTVWETCVRSLGWKDTLEEGMATHSSILAWRIPVDRGAWRATVHGVSESGTTKRRSTAEGTRSLWGWRESLCSQKVTAVSQAPPSLHMLRGLHLSPAVCGSRIETEGNRQRREATGPDDSRSPISSPGTSGPTFSLEAGSVKAEAKVRVCKLACLRIGSQCGTRLAAQWLGFHVSTTRGQGLSPHQGTKIPQA